MNEESRNLERDAQHKARHRMRRLTAVLALAVLVLAALGTAPAAADNPEPFPDSFSFPSINPCTGAPHLVTIDVMVRFHEHHNNFVINITRSGSTSDGFVMHNGTETQNYNPVSEVATTQFKDFWRNSETGQRFHVRGNQTLVFGDGIEAPPTEVRVENFSLRCIGAPTLLP